MRIVPIKPMNWPQDRLQPPPGFGRMTRITPENQHLTKGEPFTYGGTVTVQPQTTGTLIIPILPDADFWCDMMSAQVDGAFFAPGSRCQVEDIRNGYQFFFPQGRLTALALVVDPTPPGFNPTFTHVSGTLLQPYCFTRNSGIKISIFNNDTAIGAAHSFDMTFSGWKEYEHVAQ